MFPKNIKKKIEDLSHTVYMQTSKNKEFYHQHMVKLITEELRDQEIRKVTDLIKEVSFADANKIENVFD